MVEKSITRRRGGNKIDYINETDKPQASQIKKDKYIRNESKKYFLLDKSRSSQITETEDIVKRLKKARSISSASLFDKSINIEQPK